MDKWQDSLVNLGKYVFSPDLGESERLDKNFVFVKTLVSALKEKHSFIYRFDKLSTISILYSPDDSFRIFSWNVPLNDGSYLYYGAIQKKSKDGKLNLTPLLDKTFEINKPDNSILSADNWYGAQYYDIIPWGNRYILLGWKGHTPEFSQKVIEILQFKDGAYQLGEMVFLNESTLTRKIFNFTRQATMYLQFDSTSKNIVFDHLVPINDSLKGVYKYYGPDLSHDAYRIKDQGLELIENVTVRNGLKVENDNGQKPGQAVKGKKSGL
ncbi:hypothetical protein [Sphingobacterium sp. LRF_L2]|uniref:hypothetical protein n=1 Tax=Sphingobacterium sp. LRF_L2 TaxID=3369421 RepID=UPI003F646700